MGDAGLWRKVARNAEEFGREVEALRLLGPGCVRLVDVEDGVLLLERVDPGSNARDLADEDATTAIANTLRSLWQPVPEGCTLPTVDQECHVLGDDAALAPLPRQIVAAARRELDRLLEEKPTPAVLHGDLHHDNLLWSDSRGWVAIDPHGLVGDPGYDVGPMLINPWGSDVVALLDRRLDLLHELLAIPRDRLAGWGLVRAVVSEAWTVQTTGRPDGGPLAVAHALSQGPRHLGPGGQRRGPSRS